MTVEVKEVLQLKDIPYTISSDGSYLFKITPDNFIPIAKRSFEEGFIHLSTIVGYEQSNEIVTLNYPLYRYETKISNQLHSIPSIPVDAITLSIDISYSDLKISSVDSIFKNSSIYERELVDILGISFIDRDYVKNEFLFNKSYPKDFFPLRKSASSLDLKKKLDELNIISQKPDPLSENKFDYSFSIGPQHPTHKEPVRFQFYVEGETIKDVAFRIGFNHRGIEKAIEMKRVHEEFKI